MDLPYPTVLPDWSRKWAPNQIDFRQYTFNVERNQAAARDTASEDTVQAQPRDHARLIPKNYRLNYALDKLQTQLNNTFGTSFYQPYNGQVNAQPGLGNASEIRLSDVMDDHHVVGGYTIPVNLSNTFFGLAYLNLSRTARQRDLFSAAGKCALRSADGTPGGNRNAPAAS